MPGQHSRLAPSAAGRWVNCPGSVTLEPQFPHPESPKAKEGTAAHWLAAECLGTPGMDPASLVNQNADNGVTITDEMVEGVRVYLDAVNRPIAGAGCGLNIEKTLRMPAIHADAYGTVDASAVDYTRAAIYVWDFKFGFAPVEVFENMQLAMYAVGVLSELDFGKFVTQMPTIHMTVVQPRAWHPDGPVRTWSVPLQEMRGYTKRLTVAAAEALGPNPQCRTGNHCVYCNGRHGCAALREAVGMAVQYAHDPVPQEMDNDALAVELSIISEARDLLEYRAKALEAQAIDAATKGAALRGWRLEQGYGKKKFTCTPAVLEMVGRKSGVDVFKKEPITPNQAVKAGLDPAVVDGLSGRSKTGMKIVPEDNTTARKVFSK